MMPLIRAIVIGIIIFAAAMYMLHIVTSDVFSDPREGKELPLAFTAQNGIPFNINSYRGHVVVIDFWATWCEPCKAELPEIIALYNKYHDRGLEVVGVSLDQDQGTLNQFTASNGMPWPEYFDGQGFSNAISSKFGITGIPTVWIVDKHGVLVSTHGNADLETQVLQYMAEP